VSATWTLPGDRTSVCAARKRVAATLAPAGLPAPVVDDVTLAVSELASNAVKHTHSGRPGGRYALAVQVTAAEVWVTVVDQGGPRCPRLPRDADPTADLCADLLAEGGRGLAALRRMGGRVGWEGGPTGRRVWVALPRTTGETAPNGAIAHPFDGAEGGER
jgi:anti-sigma regulatory factor (Ser/Thr protein kinase)